MDADIVVAPFLDGRFSEAEQSYTKALAVWQHDADTHRNLGILYELYMGRLLEAQQHYLQYHNTYQKLQMVNAIPQHLDKLLLKLALLDVLT